MLDIIGTKSAGQYLSAEILSVSKEIHHCQQYGTAEPFTSSGIKHPHGNDGWFAASNRTSNKNK